MKLKILYSFLAASLLIGGCTEEADLSLETTYLGLVVDGQITTDTTSHTVTLLKSGDVLNKKPVEYVSGAIVSISDGSQVFTLTENPARKGVYETASNVYGVQGETYTLNISNVDVNGDGKMEAYTASSAIAPINPIDSIKLIRQSTTDFANGWSINMYSRDIGGGRNYYLIKARKNHVLVTDSIKEFGTGNNAGFEGKYYFGASVYFLYYGKLDERLDVNDTVTLELSGISKEYADYIEAYKIEYNPKNPIFSGPSANPKTNIVSTEKASGFFAAYAIQRKSRIYK